MAMQGMRKKGITGKHPNRNFDRASKGGKGWSSSSNKDQRDRSTRK